MCMCVTVGVCVCWLCYGIGGVVRHRSGDVGSNSIYCLLHVLMGVTIGRYH